MTTLRPFTSDDMYTFNNVNLDPLTETYGLSFYMQYLAHWPEYFQVAESPSGEIMGYIMGKAEGMGENWHGHVTALTVSPDFRRLGLAATLMSYLEDVSEKKRAYFVDLFVRVSNKVAINMYKNLGYIVYRTVLEYYSGDPDEDAYGEKPLLEKECYDLSFTFCNGAGGTLNNWPVSDQQVQFFGKLRCSQFTASDMRKACSRDINQRSVVPLTHPVRPEDVD